MTAPAPESALDRLNNWITRREKIIFMLAPLVLPFAGAIAYRYLVIDDVMTRVAVVERAQLSNSSDVTDILTFQCLHTPLDSLRTNGLFHMIARCQNLLAGR